MHRARATRLLVLAALLCASSPASAAEDDFEFGRRLAAKGYFDYARRVYEGMIRDDRRSAEERARAKYGLALLGRDEAYAAARRPDVPYAEAKAKFDAALKAVDDYVAQAGADPRVDEARLEAGGLRLGIVQILGDLQKDDKGIAQRQTTRDALVADAKAYVSKAIDLFRGLREKASKDETKAIASYYYAMAQYFRGYAEAPCSEAAVAAFDEAAKGLEDYASVNDDKLIGMYALDTLGRTDWERAKCQNDPQKREERYLAAAQWFEACTNTPNETIEHTKVIALGYYHLGQLCLEARRQERTDFLKYAASALARLPQVDRLNRVEDGVRAMLEWAEIEDVRGNGSEAFRIARAASDAAKEIDFDEGVRKANAAMRRYMQRANAVDLDPDALFKIAESIFNSGKYDEAVPAYQQAILASARSDQARAAFALPSWDRVATSYHKQGLFFEAATAWDVVVSAWRLDPKKGAEGDPKTDLAYRSARGMKDSLERLAELTRDPTIQARLAALNEELPKLFPMVSGAQDAAYAQAIQLLNEALKAREDGSPEGVWRPKKDRGIALLRETAQNLRSERQDNAWANLAYFSLRFDEPAEALRHADEALAFWETPAAKKRLLEEGDRIGANRTTQRARVDLHKAQALVDLRRIAEALPIVRGYAGRWPTAETLWKQLALGIEIQAVLDAGRIEEAETLLKGMMSEYPGYHDLGRIVIAIANHYKAKAQPMLDRLERIKAELAALQKRLNEAGALEIRALERLDGLQKELTLQIRKRDTLPDDRREERQRAAEEVGRLEKALPGAVEDLEKARAARAAIEALVPPLLEEQGRLRRDVAEPLALAARRYVDWDEVVKALDETSEKKQRVAENVRGFAYNYFQLAGLRPDRPEYWQEARRLYEDYLAMPETKALSESDPKKRSAHGNLGEVYYALALAEADREKARPLYEQAVGNLEKALARVAGNTALVVGLLSGEYVTLPFEDPALRRRFYIPVRRAADGAAFRRDVEAMRPGEPPLPRFAPGRSGDESDYARAVANFKIYVRDMDAAAADRTAKSLQAGGFDAPFFAEHADARVETLLPLARAYIRSGLPEYSIRAYNAAQNVLRGHYKPEDGSADWWQVQTVVLNYFVSEAERGAAAGGAAQGEAATHAKIADKMISSFKRLFPRIGGAERHEETLAEWKSLQARLAKAAATLGVSTANVDLAAEVPIAGGGPDGGDGK
jgi:hypothetical protein